MPICPRGHESQAEDWCDFCGFPMTPPPGLGVPGSSPFGAPAAPSGPPAPPAAPPMPPSMAQPMAPPPIAPGQAQQDVTAGLVTCPICRTPQTGRYCEECGYDYDLSSPPQRQSPPSSARPAGTPAGYGYPPPAPAPYQPPVPPPAPTPTPYEPPAPPPAPMPEPSPFPPPAPFQPSASAPDPFGQAAPYRQPDPFGQPSPYGQGAPQGTGAQHGQGAPQGQGTQHGQGAPQGPGTQHGQAAAHGQTAPPHRGQAPQFPDSDGFDGFEQTGPVYAQPGPSGTGDDFGTSFRIAPPDGAPAAPPAQPVRTTWMAVVSADRDYFTDMMARSGPEAAGLFFPPYCPERRIPLTGRGQLRIGRRSQHRGTVPEIDLSVPPEDPGASHQHAMLAEQADGSWVLVDQDSTNGTTVNGGSEPVPPHTAIPLNDGDRVHIGAWTTITLHRA